MSDSCATCAMPDCPSREEVEEGQVAPDSARPLFAALVFLGPLLGALAASAWAGSDQLHQLLAACSALLVSALLLSRVCRLQRQRRPETPA